MSASMLTGLSSAASMLASNKKIINSPMAAALMSNRPQPSTTTPKPINSANTPDKSIEKAIAASAKQDARNKELDDRRHREDTMINLRDTRRTQELLAQILGAIKGGAGSGGSGLLGGAAGALAGVLLGESGLFGKLSKLLKGNKPTLGVDG